MLKYLFYLDRLIAVEMAKMHSIDTDKVCDIQLSKDPCLWWKTKKYLEISPDGFDEPERMERYKTLVHINLYTVYIQSIYVQYLK